MKTFKDGKGKFGCILGELWFGGTHNINQILVDNHYAVRYHGQSKEEIAEEHLANREKLNLGEINSSIDEDYQFGHNSQYRWIFNKLEYRLGYDAEFCVPITKPNKYIIRPIYNLYGMGVGAKVKSLDPRLHAEDMPHPNMCRQDILV